MQRLLWWLEDRWDRILVYFGLSDPLNGARVTSFHKDEVDLFDPLTNAQAAVGMGRLMRMRNDRQLQWMAWQAGLGDGMVPCDGRTLEKDDYPSLYAALGIGQFPAPDPWLDLGGIEFDFGWRPMQLKNGWQNFDPTAPAALTQFG